MCDESLTGELFGCPETRQGLRGQHHIRVDSSLAGGTGIRKGRWSNEAVGQLCFRRSADAEEEKESRNGPRVLWERLISRSPPERFY